MSSPQQHRPQKPYLNYKHIPQPTLFCFCAVIIKEHIAPLLTCVTLSLTVSFPVLKHKLQDEDIFVSFITEPPVPRTGAGRAGDQSTAAEGRTSAHYFVTCGHAIAVLLYTL